MKKFILSVFPAILAGAILAAGAAGCAQTSTDHTHIPPATEMKDKAVKEVAHDHNAAEKSSEKFIAVQTGRFDPVKLTAKAGDTVTWVNKDSEPHEIHADDDAFESSELEPGQSFAQKFTAAGDFGYHDHLHEEVKGMIMVE